MATDPNFSYAGNVIWRALDRLDENPDRGDAWRLELREYLRQTMLEMGARIGTISESDPDFPGTWRAALAVARSILIHTDDPGGDV